MSIKKNRVGRKRRNGGHAWRNRLRNGWAVTGPGEILQLQWKIPTRGKNFTQQISMKPTQCKEGPAESLSQPCPDIIVWLTKRT
jgi:hypothetical protein